MAESVDALVSNTSGAIRPGSTPGLGTESRKVSHTFLLFSLSGGHEVVLMTKKLPADYLL